VSHVRFGFTAENAKEAQRRILTTRKESRNMPTHVYDLTRVIIGAAIEVHRALGPGLLESAYQTVLARELELQTNSFKYEWPLPLALQGVQLDGIRMESSSLDSVIVETKSYKLLCSEFMRHSC
jgi:GxxExxY protein